MTSKSPVRSCDDIDETALSYAEIKALCAGDERIKEKMDLDVDVARLKLMKANHLSQQYRLEDNLLRYFPEQIEQNKGFIAGFEADMQTLAEHPHPVDGFAGMTVRGDTLTDKENAGAALMDAFKEVKGLDPVPIGSYRGFQMSLTLEDFGRDYVLTLKGQMTHRVILGKDPRGNLTRIDNVLNGIRRIPVFFPLLDMLHGWFPFSRLVIAFPTGIKRCPGTNTIQYERNTIRGCENISSAEKRWEVEPHPIESPERRGAFKGCTVNVHKLPSSRRYSGIDAFLFVIQPPFCNINPFQGIIIAIALL